MARLSALEIYEIARQAGFSRDAAVTWTAIALAESGGDPQAHATAGEDSRGLWQINVNPAVRPNSWGNLYDPLTNARAAYQVSGHGTNSYPWSVTHEANRGTTRDYRRYLPQAESAAVAAGGNPATPTSGGDPVTPTSGGDPATPTTERYRPIPDATLTDTFGAPRAGGRKHEGIDIFAREGTPIHAVTGGTVVKGFDDSLGGVVVRIQGDDGRYYYYAHLRTGSTSGLSVGQHVATGQVIGQVGDTGSAAGTPPHLHLQVRENGTWVNPYDFLVPLDDWGEGSGGAADPYAIQRGANPGDRDADADGLTDRFESLLRTDVHRADTDADGLSDAYESSVSHTDPRSADTDGDGVPDAVEVAQDADPGRAVVPGAAARAGFGGLGTLDTDRDGLSDRQETELGTSVTQADTDADTVPDTVELAHGTDPRLLDSDSDGLTDRFTTEHDLFEADPGTGTGLGDQL